MVFTNPLGAAGPMLLLPNGRATLEFVDQVLTGLEGIAPMGRRHRDADRRLANLQRTDTVDSCAPKNRWPSLPHLVDHLRDLRFDHSLVGLILEVGDSFTSPRVVADSAKEEDNSPGCGVRDDALDRGRINGGSDHLDVVRPV